MSDSIQYLDQAAIDFILKSTGSDHIHRAYLASQYQGEGWYWEDQDFVAQGPYKSEAQARDDMREYFEEVER